MLRDDRLRLLFAGCRPALSFETQTAPALRTSCGMSTAKIATVVLVPEPTMGQRISRAKKKISSARIPYRIPADHELPDRLPSVTAVIHAVVTPATMRRRVRWMPAATQPTRAFGWRDCCMS